MTADPEHAAIAKPAGVGERRAMAQTYSEMIDAHRVKRRVQLLRAAADVLEQRGLRQATMDQVATQAGVSKVILYRYFKSKDGLVDAVLEEVVEAILEADREEAAWWTDRIRRTLPVARAHAAAMKLLVRHAAHDPIFGVHLERLTAALVEAVIERETEILGPEPSAPGPAMIMAEAVTAFMLDSYVRWIEQGDAARDDQFVEWITKSVRSIVYHWRGLDP
ncbi:helix-turn-helix domain containing protein [Sphingomonas sp. AOB5]|uniref:TetR/AcrR family transcriptional regulator n=1 Tax=Sphingomonas sp. AOB5 TaxID=3034017 RepID=UPI0023F95593|nr:TetR/AcrR family transcriptional regulator [Sphingomonas sp. AOB5]MDF7774799.1 helix-turn-helix domain containing protein [Sphingomonas sp. AOB5]